MLVSPPSYQAFQWCASVHATGARTAWEAATLIPGVQRLAYPVWDEAVGAADFERESGARIEHASPYITVTGDALGDGGVEVAEPVQPGRFGQPGYAGGGQRLPC